MSGGATTGHVHTHLDGAILSVRLDRPDKKNALDQPMYRALTQALTEAAAPSIRVILLSGAPGAFCAGNDIGDFLRYAQTGEGLEDTFAFMTALGTLDTPIVAAVDGLAIGIGATLMFHCDLAFATPRSVFRTPFLDLGVVPEAGSSLLAPLYMGQRNAFDLLVAGAAFDAAAAERTGLISRVVGEDALEATARQAAERLAAKPPEALAIARRLLRGDPAALQARITQELALFEERLRSREAREAFAAFMARSSSPAG